MVVISSSWDAVAATAEKKSSVSNELCIIGLYSVFHGPRQQLTTNVVMSAVIMDCWLLLPVVSKRTVYEVA